MKLSGIVLSFVMLAGVGLSEDIKPIPESTQNKVLKAQHDYDALVGQEKDVQLQFEQAIRTQKQITESYPELDKKTQAAGKFLETVELDAVKEAGLDSNKYVFDITKMTFIPKAPTAPSTTPAPEKK